jgi:hypothetical protein
MKTWIELKDGNPGLELIIRNEAKLIVKAHRESWGYRVQHWWGLHCPVWLDREWWKWKVTGKSEFYGVDWGSSHTIFGPPCPRCLCEDTENGKPGCVCSCHGWESID